MDRRSRQAPQRAATKLLARITERLAIRVKGLTAVFCVLLLTNPAQTRRPAGAQKGVATAAMGLFVAADA
jgi:hypothetical protein